MELQYVLSGVAI